MLSFQRSTAFWLVPSSSLQGGRVEKFSKSCKIVNSLHRFNCAAVAVFKCFIYHDISGTLLGLRSVLVS